MGASIKQQLLSELNKATPEFLWQIFQFVQFLKRAEQRTVPPKPGTNPVTKFIGCLTPQEGDAFAAVIEQEFNRIEGEW